MNFRDVPIGSAFDVQNGATPASGEPSYWDGDTPWVSPADLGKLNTRFIENGERSITQDGYASCGTQMVPAGSIILSIRAPIGHIAIASNSMCFNQGCRGLVPRSMIRSDFSYWALVACRPKLEAAGQGTTFIELSRDKLRSERIPIPVHETQKAIADFLDRETARIDQLIEKKQRMVSLLSSRWESLFHFGRRDASTEHIRFKFITTRSQRQIRLDGGDEFTPLGLYNRGRGYFKKDITPSQELGDSTFFLVREGDLILSGQFAWEGAVALADEDANGCVVSHRYPVYVGTRGVLTAYLYAYFRTADGQFMLDNCSRGAAGRNRPLNTNILEREKILLLPRRIQEKVARLVGQEQAVKKVVTTSLDRLREFRSALITAAVTGQIDVSTWSNQGTSDRRLDQIEEATSA